MPRSMNSRTVRFFTLSIATALVAALAGCSGAPFGLGSARSLPNFESAPESESAKDSALVDGVAPGDAALTDGLATHETRQSIIRTSQLYIEVTDPQAASQRVAEAVEPMNGTIESSSISAPGEWGDAQASLIVRVPAERMEEAMAAISSVGDVVSETRSAVDVSLEQRDLTARVAALEVSIERLLDLMNEATTTADLLAAESALTERQAELDGLQSQLAYLNGQVSEATISVTLSAPGTSPTAGPANFWEALLLGVSSLGAALVGLGLALGVALPWLVAAALIAGIIVAIVRSARHRAARRARVLNTPTESVDPQTPGPQT